MNKRLYRVGIVLLSVFVILGGQFTGVASRLLGSKWLDASESAKAAFSSESRIYVPIVKKEFPFTSAFGAELKKIQPDHGLYMMSTAGTSWLRGAFVRWSEVEPNKGDRNWSALSNLDSQLKMANSHGFNTILTITSTPAWAQKFTGYFCGPVKESELTAFASFMYDLVSRYSREPFNVSHWELWNEPDAPPGADKYSIFGCWGENEPYYGGGYYATMLKTVYPVIKSVDPEAQVMVGGLLLDCHPALGCAGSDARQPLFFEGILKNEGGAFFDGVSFHAYDYYSGRPGRYVSPKWGSSQSTGPVVIAKANYLNGLMNNYGVTGKFLINTETALICGLSTDPPGQWPCSTEPSSSFEKTKANYVAQVYAAGQALNLKASIWYSVFGWRNSGLLNRDLSTRPAYTAYSVARHKLSDSTFVRAITEYPNVLGYEFHRGDRRIWVIWSGDVTDQVIDLPGNPLAIEDALGSEIPIADPLTVSFVPLYLEWTP